MKYVLLSADNYPSVYLVPDVVAENLREYCLEFYNNWLQKSPYAKKYHRNGMIHYDETAFIEYLNEWVFPKNPSTFVVKLDWMNSFRSEDIPEPYTDCEWFNF